MKYKLFKSLSLLFCALFIQLSFTSVTLAEAVDVPMTHQPVITDDALSCTLQRIANTMSGPMGKLIATIAIIALGIGLFMGKLSWGLAVATAMGIAMIFGAENIVNWLSGYQFTGQIICEPYV